MDRSVKDPTDDGSTGTVTSGDDGRQGDDGGGGTRGDDGTTGHRHSTVSRFRSRAGSSVLLIPPPES